MGQGDQVSADFVSQGIYSPILEYTKVTNGVQVNKAKNYYSNTWFNDKHISARQRVEFAVANTPLRELFHINNYDSKGNILDQQNANDMHEVYLWGYKGQYPVAKIMNTTFDIAKNYVTQSVLDAPANDAALRSHLNNLRNIPGALVTTYTYKPLIGITSETDPNGKTIYYEYDAFNRLALIRDKDNNILKKICYNYAGQPENCLTCTDFTANWQNTSTALRCQESSQSGNCGNTGYQEQEQKDLNICSPTYNTTRWVLAGYNPAACAIAVCVNLTSTNTVGEAGYIATYYNLSSGKTYSFTVSSASGSQALGTIPAGSYNLTIAKPGTTMSRIFKSGCKFQTITGSIATFYNISVASNTCNSISIAPNLEY